MPGRIWVLESGGKYEQLPPAQGRFACPSGVEDCYPACEIAVAAEMPSFDRRSNGSLTFALRNHLEGALVRVIIGLVLNALGSLHACLCRLGCSRSSKIWAGVEHW
jgi:hypothetical protein